MLNLSFAIAAVNARRSGPVLKNNLCMSGRGRKPTKLPKSVPPTGVFILLTYRYREVVAALSVCFGCCTLSLSQNWPTISFAGGTKQKKRKGKDPAVQLQPHSIVTNQSDKKKVHRAPNFGEHVSEEEPEVKPTPYCLHNCWITNVHQYLWIVYDCL